MKQEQTFEEIKWLLSAVAAKAMLQRVGYPDDDIACAVSLLVSEEPGFITGQVLSVEGERMDYIGRG